MATTHNTAKRPKLSLSIKPSNNSSNSNSNSNSNTPSIYKTSRSKAAVNPRSPTAFNTLSNVYVTAIERSTPVATVSAQPQSLRIQTDMSHFNGQNDHSKAQTPRVVSYPQTPLSAGVSSPTPIELAFPSSIMTATPPLSTGPVDADEPKKFTFSKADIPTLSLVTAVTTTTTTTTTTNTNTTYEPKLRTPRKRVAFSDSPAPRLNPPYTHPRTLHSILRNSPLPSRSVRSPMSPCRKALLVREKASRRVAYHSPLEQTITTNKYTKSHIDLLIEDLSPHSPAAAQQEADSVLDLALAFTGDETRDGGQTPGPFEEMRRRMAGLAAATPRSPAAARSIQKRKPKEKKRRWVWTIGQEGEEDENEEELSGAIAAMRAVEARASSDPLPGTAAPAMLLQQPWPSHASSDPGDLPTPSVESFDDGSDVDMDMSDSSSFVSSIGSDERALTPEDFEVSARTPPTPTLKRKSPDSDAEAEPTMEDIVRSARLATATLWGPETGSSMRDHNAPMLADVMVA